MAGSGTTASRYPDGSPHPLRPQCLPVSSIKILILNTAPMPALRWNTSGILDIGNNEGIFSWPFESVDFPISLTEPTIVNGQVVLLNGRLLSTGGSNSVKVGFAISSEGLLPRYDLGWEVHQAALNIQNGFSHAYQPLKSNTTYYYRAYAENEAGRWFGSVKKFKSARLKSIKVHYSGNLVPLGTAGMKTHGSVFSIYRQTDGLTTWTLGWIYLPENNQDGIWLWSAERQGWIWTKSEIWPHLWEHNERSWTYFRKIDNRPYFFNFKSESYE